MSLGRSALFARAMAPVVAMLALALTACSCPPPAHAQGQAGTPPQPQATPSAGRPQESTMESPKRRVPSVAPVVAGKTRYEVVRGARSRGFAQNGGVIAAIDVAGGQELWTLQLYQTRYDTQEEQDVQDRFITEMTLSPDGQNLLVKSENKKTYMVRLADRSVTVQP